MGEFREIGDIKYSLQTDDHDGWLLCDGRSLLCNRHHLLHRVISNKFGSLSSNTFNLPNCKGKILACAGTGNNLTPRSVGDNIGTSNVTVNNSQLASHQHDGVTYIGGVHNHGGVTTADGLHSHSGFTNNNTADGLHGHYVLYNSIDGLTYNNSFNALSSLGNYVASASTSVNNPFISSTPDPSDQNHVNGIDSDNYHNHTINYDGGHLHTFTTNYKGGNEPHNNIQPTIIIGNIFIYSGYFI